MGCIRHYFLYVLNINAYPRKSTTIFITFFKIDLFYFFPLSRRKTTKNLNFLKRKGMLVLLLGYALLLSSYSLTLDYYLPLPLSFSNFPTALYYSANVGSLPCFHIHDFYLSISLERSMLTPSSAEGERCQIQMGLRILLKVFKYLKRLNFNSF